MDTTIDPTTIRSHATSGVLHGLFLALAFMTPVTLVLDAPPEWAAAERVATFDAREVVVQTRAPEPRTIDEFIEHGQGGVPARGEGDHDGARAGLKVRSEPPEPTRKLAADPALGFVEEMGGLLAGFADETVGPDTVMALGALDDGGGGNSFGGLGFGMAGRGASCGRVWETSNRGVRVVKHEGCKGIGLGAIGMAGSAEWGRGRDHEPDLGDKKDIAVTPTVLTRGAVGCTTDTACPWKEIVGKVIARHKRELEYCYDRSLNRQQHAFSADIDVSFTIPPAGGLATISAPSTGITDFDTCIHSRLSRWIFPETGLHIRALYPFRFAVPS